MTTAMPSVETPVDVSWFREIMNILANQGVGVVFIVFLIVMLWRMSPKLYESMAAKNLLAEKLGRAVENVPHLLERLVVGVESIAKTHEPKVPKNPDAG